MGGLTQITIDFEASHLLFPKIVAIVLGILGFTIVLRDRAQIANAGSFWRQTLSQIDKPRFFGTIFLTLLYFALMVPVGEIWPNTGLGFLICSILFMMLTGLLYMHDHRKWQIVTLILVAFIAPTFVWWLFTYPFFLTLP